MDKDPRAEELFNLRLALTTFALHLDAFEGRLRSFSSKTTTRLQPTAPATGFANNIVSAMKSADTTGRNPKSN
jgi:hypothetical protein